MFTLEWSSDDVASDQASGYLDPDPGVGVTTPASLPHRRWHGSRLPRCDDQGLGRAGDPSSGQCRFGAFRAEHVSLVFSWLSW